MNTLIAWAGFVGGWALVAGPVYQAALELKRQQFERERLAEVMASVGRPEPVSAWWWLLPPVAYLKTRRAQKVTRDEVTARLDRADLEHLVSFIDTAAGWMLVGFGGFCIALKETWELREHYEWGVAVFWGLAALMLGISALYVAARERRSAHILGRSEG